LVVLSGPSGVGKTTVCHRLLLLPGIDRVVTATTRPPRNGEADGRDYVFLSERVFEDRLRQGWFLEEARVFGHRYGTPVESVDRLLRRGRVPLLAIDVQGAEQVRRRMPGALFLFLAPPSWEELEARLRGRGTDAPQVQARRLEEARREWACRDRYDCVVVNDDLERTVGEIRDILRREIPSLDIQKEEARR
jgi:guanylate kinase